MIYEHRTYQVQAGKAGEFLKIYETEGLGIITRYARLIGCWTKESGVLNSVVFIWAYEDFAHRTAQRQKLAQDPTGRSSPRRSCPIWCTRRAHSSRPSRFPR